MTQILLFLFRFWRASMWGMSVLTRKGTESSGHRSSGMARMTQTLCKQRVMYRTWQAEYLQLMQIIQEFWRLTNQQISTKRYHSPVQIASENAQAVILSQTLWRWSVSSLHCIWSVKGPQVHSQTDSTRKWLTGGWHLREGKGKEVHRRTFYESQ